MDIHRKQYYTFASLLPFYWFFMPSISQYYTTIYIDPVISVISAPALLMTIFPVLQVFEMTWRELLVIFKPSQKIKRYSTNLQVNVLNIVPLMTLFLRHENFKFDKLHKPYFLYCPFCKLPFDNIPCLPNLFAG